MWLLLAIFIIVKLLVFHKMQNMHLDVHNHKLCPNGYHGLVNDPFDCNVYYSCPQKTQFYCPPDEQFDVERQLCIPNDIHDDSCMARKYKSLLL
ncbi:ORF-14 peptide [Chrysodeixis chalcites nucleopolyhedrovirus]|uniref:ORF-14 peptide n=1 Tax=Chrysodeixis chalcites nucleopolyhedrovirus TaxID=320432 RepID=Q4KT66_9ABAC|nr:ORF-14 peptide [Chrysodeixis chalcites nucleopolyhedrovirus]AGC36229.1 hypothetical protein TF1A_0014 [Chrysodeixis chalcites SNPV TF1-A]AAY83945.1 ORF-14 peptide [Chrysodeixis chalcites nucleopolyhedrovirus]AGE61276.1 hypothetical protein [Chrysodeixis chalcites nucleopolyhedrovirus]AGE61425.1 hypothetical protein [Chrysodeixis chalcites nucleopolyhedrovirus]AGE61574.1 hypothetical protein [Chrysodeixis chalcites nucleopolyhedrovirus]